MTALAVCALLVGCQSLRFPAIDPSGRRLFLPPPNYTTLAGPSPASPRFGLLPTPAWSAPTRPPPCLDAPPPPTAFVEPECGVAVPAPSPAVVVPQSVPAPPREQLTLTPKSILAPVGSEVVLVAGLCSGQGYYVMRQPIDWTLSRDSVGQFVQVPNEHNPLRFWWATRPGKRSADLAVGRTQVLPRTITQGNADPSDDVYVASGQSWISVTSAVEGASRVMAYSPGVDDWSQRKQTATIYWVDAQWTLPAPAVAPAGQTHLFVTRLTRSDGVTPLCGYVVRYEVVGGPPASFAPSGGSAADVISDDQGNAAVEVSQAPNQPGTTQIRIQIVRPPQAAGEPTLTLGEGFTSLTWSAPGLALSIDGPASAALESTLTYQITVSNPGDQPTRDVVVSDVLPPGLSLISSEPPGTPLGDRLEWRLGELPGLASQTITLHCRAARRGDVQHCASARSAESLAADDCVATRIFSPSLTVNMTGPPTAEVGQQIEFRVEISNTGPEPLRGVTLTDQFDAGLAHLEEETSPIRRALGDLAAGQTVRIAVQFRVTSPGRLCHTLEATADAGEKGVATACVTATQPAAPVAQDRPELRASLTGPADMRAGETALFTISVANTGNVALTGVQIGYRYPVSLEPGSATGGHEHVAGVLIWRVANLPVGQRTELQVQCRALRADIGAVGRVEVSSEQNAGHTAEVTTRVAPAVAPGAGPGAETGPGPEIGPGPQNGNVTGSLTVSIADQADPVRAGQSVAYTIVVKNDRNASDKNVAITLTFPEGIAFRRISGPLRAPRSSERQVELDSIAELRAGEQIVMRVDAEALRAGQFAVTATAKSLRSPEGVSDEEQTTVNAE